MKKEEESVAVAWPRLRKIKDARRGRLERCEREREGERDVTKKRDERRRKGREGMNEWREDQAGVVAGKAG